LVATAFIASPFIAVCQPASGKSEAPYGLTIRAKQREYKIGSSVRIEIIRKNISGHDIERFETGAGQAQFLYTVTARDANGVSAPESELGKAIKAGDAYRVGSSYAGLPLGTLKPGEFETDEIVLDRLFDLTTGRYTVRVYRREPKSDLVMESDAITIAIVK